MTLRRKLILGTSVVLISLAAVPLYRDFQRSRMAANATAAAGVCRKYCEAQEIFHRSDHNGDNVLEYAQSLRELDAEHLLPEGVSSAELDAGAPSPYHGYVFRVLKRQGGKLGMPKDYIKDGHMTQGYGLVAFRADYGTSGIPTAVISNSGTIYMKDLGVAVTVGRKTVEFDPSEYGNWG